MSSVPVWLGAAASQSPLAGQINQFLGAHPAAFLYQGTVQSAQTTAGSGSVSTFGSYQAQTFTTGSSQTAIGYVTCRVSTTSPAPTTPLQVSIYATSGGAPTGSPLITVTAAPEYVTFAPAFDVFPVPLTVTPSTMYAIVTAPSGNSGTQDYTWGKSNQTSGAFTSSTGSSWSSQTYGLEYQVFDQSAVGPLTATWEDAGARWCWFSYSAANQLQKLSEYTAAQASGYLQSNRTFTYSGNLLVGVS